MLIPGTNSIKDTSYNVANSCRFDDGSSPYLTESVSSTSNRRTFTFSTWVKRSSLSGSGYPRLFNPFVDSANFFDIFFRDTDALNVYSENGASNDMNLVTNRLFRDFSAWYHIVVAVDTTQGVAANRVKLYINGVQETSFSTETYPSADTDFQINLDTVDNVIGRNEAGDNNYLDGYLSEVVFIDGLQLAPTSFGEFDEDSPTIWKPIDVSGLTFGTNGFYLDFEDSANLGNDANGGTDFTESNIAATDSSTDSPTNNFATWNPLIKSNGTLSEGNVKLVTNNDTTTRYGYRLSTIGMSSGKWYAEVKYTSSSNQALIGIRSREATDVLHYIGHYADDYGFYLDGHYYNNNSDGGDLGASWTSGDIIGIYLDLDNNKLYFSKNGALYSSTGISITAAASTTTGFYFFGATEWNSSGNGTFELNTGGSPSFSITSSNTDGDYGNFEYSTTITGDGSSKVFKALCTKNLAEYGG